MSNNTSNNTSSNTSNTSNNTSNTSNNTSNTSNTSNNASLELAKMTTGMSNERTYLAYVRTGLAIVTIAIPFKKYYIMILGLIMIFVSTIEFYFINNNLNKNNFNIVVFVLMPLFATAIIFFIFYLELKNIKQTKNFNFKKLFKK